MTGSQQGSAPTFGFRGMADMDPGSAYARSMTTADNNTIHQNDSSDGYRPVSPDLTGLGTSTGYRPQSPDLTGPHVERSLPYSSFGGREIYVPPRLDNPLFGTFPAPTTT